MSTCVLVFALTFRQLPPHGFDQVQELLAVVLAERGQRLVGEQDAAALLVLARRRAG